MDPEISSARGNKERFEDRLADTRDVLAVKADRARGWIDEPEREPADRALARAGFPDEAEHLTARDLRRSTPSTARTRRGATPKCRVRPGQAENGGCPRSRHLAPADGNATLNDYRYPHERESARCHGSGRSPSCNAAQSGSLSQPASEIRGSAARSAARRGRLRRAPAGNREGARSVRMSRQAGRDRARRFFDDAAGVHDRRYAPAISATTPRGCA